MIVLTLAPLVFVLWWLSPWALVETERTARKTSVRSYFPRQSLDGNTPASQRVHEGGGGRLTALLMALAMCLVAAVSHAFDHGTLLFVLGTFAQIASAGLVFNLTRRWVDVAEHGAEGIHGDAALLAGELHPDAMAWIADHFEDDVETYSDGEAWRMTRKGQEYSHLDPAGFLALMRKRRWASRISVFLAKW